MRIGSLPPNAGLRTRDTSLAPSRATPTSPTFPVMMAPPSSEVRRKPACRPIFSGVRRQSATARHQALATGSCKQPQKLPVRTRVVLRRGSEGHCALPKRSVASTPARANDGGARARRGGDSVPFCSGRAPEADGVGGCGPASVHSGADPSPSQHLEDVIGARSDSGG